MNMKLKLLMEEQLQNEGKQKVLSCSRYVPAHLATPLSLRLFLRDSTVWLLAF
jgi:hypothetical protein